MSTKCRFLLVNFSGKRWTTYVATIKKKTLYPKEHSLEERFILEFLFKSHKEQSGHSYETLLRKWIKNPLNYGERLSKIALNVYHNHIRNISDDEMEAFNRAFSNENFVKDALSLCINRKHNRLDKYFYVRNYSLALPHISYNSYIKDRKFNHINKQIEYHVNTNNWIYFYRFYTLNELGFLFYVDPSTLNDENFKNNTVTYRHNTPMKAAYEELRKCCNEQLARFFELKIENRTPIDDTILTFYDMFHATNIPLLSSLLIDQLLWELLNKHAIASNIIGSKLADNFIRIILNTCYTINGNIPLMFEIGKQYYQNFLYKHYNQSYREFYNHISNQIDPEELTKENISHLPYTLGFKLSNIVLHFLVSKKFKYKNMRVFERISYHELCDQPNYNKSNSNELGYIRICPELLEHIYKRQCNIDKLEKNSYKVFQNPKQLHSEKIFVPLDHLPQLIPSLPYTRVNTTNGMVFSKMYPISNFYEPVLFEKYNDKSSYYPYDKFIDALNILNNIPLTFNQNIIQAITVLKADNKDSWFYGEKAYYVSSDKAIKLFTPENEDHMNDVNILHDCLQMAKNYYEISNSSSTSLNYTLRSIEIAKNFEKSRPFYLTYRCDYRGRYFPISYINHHSTDIIRSLFKFHQEKLVDDSALKFLKIHLYITKYGRDRSGKMSPNDYIKCIDKEMDFVLESANNYQQCEWWRSGNPKRYWQTLAICFEIKNALANPGSYRSSYPVKVDLTATFITHLSLLLKDENLARLSTLSKIIFDDSTSDFYEYMAERVKQLLEETQPQNLELFNQLYPEIVAKNLLNPSAIKPLIVKNIFTPFTRKINPNQSSNEFSSFLKENPQFLNFRKSLIKELDLIVKKAVIDKQLSTITAFKGWLEDMINNICGDGRFPSWFSPSGLHVMPIFLEISKYPSQFNWLLGDYEVEDCADIRKQGLTPKKYKYINSSLPNLIDSIDAALFTNVIISCKEENITLMGVHDSYWTHACDVERLQNIIKREIYKMYSEPILERFYEDLNQNLSTKAKYKVPPFSRIGKLDITPLINSNHYICL